MSSARRRSPLFSAVVLALVAWWVQSADADYTSVLVGGTVTFTGDSAPETLVLKNQGGLLWHNRFGEGDDGYASALDVDPATPGEQTASIAALSKIVVNAGGGDDTLVIEHPAGSVIAPGVLIEYDGQAGTNDVLTLQGGGGAAFTTSYSLGPTNDAGTVTTSNGVLTQVVTYAGIEPLLDNVVAGLLIVNGSEASNAINYRVGSVATNGLVSVDNSETIEFSNKTTLEIRAFAGSDTINLGNPNTPTGLTGIVVNGGDPGGGGDTLIVTGTTAAETFEYAPSGPNSGTLVLPGPDATFSAVESVVIDGGSTVNDDTLLVRSAAGPDTIEHQPGPANDAGTFTITSAAGASSTPPLTYLALGQDDVIELLSGSPSSHEDRFEHLGTVASETVTVGPGMGGGVQMAERTPLVLTGVSTLVLQSGGGGDVFTVTTPLLFPVTVDGGPTGVLNHRPSGQQETTIDLDAGTLTRLGSPHPITFTGIGRVNHGSDDPTNLLVAGTAGDDTITVTPVGPYAGSFVRSGVGGSPLFTYSETLTLTVGGGAGGFDVLALAGTDGNDTVTMTTATFVMNVNATVLNQGAGIDRVDIDTFGGTDSITLSGAIAANVVNGGAGSDIITAAGATTPVTLHGGDGNDTLTGGAAGDTLDGGDGLDRLLGGDGPDLLRGGRGSDFLAGGPGVDFAYGEEDDDEYSWAEGDGNDRVNGGASGADRFSLVGTAGVDSVILAPTFDNRLAIFTGSSLVETADVESFSLNTLAGADTVFIEDLDTTLATRVEISVGLADGAADEVLIWGTAAADQLYLYGGSTAILYGLKHAVIISALQASDTLEVSGLESDDHIESFMDAASTQLMLRGAEGNDTLMGAGVLDGGAGNDLLIGGAAADVLLGREGNDLLVGGGGNDALDGGDGDDTLDGGASAGGNNTLDGGAGFDTIRGSGNDAANTISVAEAAGIVTFTVDATIGTNTVANIEQYALAGLGGNDAITVSAVTGRAVLDGGDGDDTLTATTAVAAMTLLGGGGNDVLTGGTAGDVLEGGDGNDRLAGGDGADVLRGGRGSDLLQGGPGVDTAFGDEDDDEYAWTQGDGDDRVSGGASAHDRFTLTGTAGVDNLSLFASTTDNRLMLATGTATVEATDVEAVSLNTLAGADAVFVGNLDTTLVSAVNIAAGPADGATDVLLLSGTAGPDKLFLHPGAFLTGLKHTVAISDLEAGDVLGVNGIQSDDYIESFITAPVPTVALIGSEGNDTLIGAGELYGGFGDDVLLGGATDDVLEGNEGDDLLIGGAGVDQLNGSSGRDLLIGGAGADTIAGGDDDDRMVWNNGDGSDVMNGENGADVVEVNGSATAGDLFTAQPGGVPGRVAFARTSPGPFTLDIGTAERLEVNGLAGDDAFTASGALALLIALQIDGGPGNDTLAGADGEDLLIGGIGSDVLIGGAGVDVLRGGDGNDTLTGSPGNDIMSGEGGDDRMIWNNGDGTDLMDGGAGTDTAEVNGAPAAGDAFVVAQNLAQVRFDRVNLGLFGLDLVTTERLLVNGLGGDDSVSVRSGVAMALLTVNGGDGNDAVTVAGGINGGALTLNGDAGNDTFTIVSQATADVSVAGGPHDAGDTLAFDADCLLVSSAAGSLTATGRRPVLHATIETITSSRTFQIAPTAFNFTGAGGAGTVNVTTGADCAWTAATNANWIDIEGASGGLDSGTVTFFVDPVDGPGRVGSLLVAGQTVSVTQGDASTALVRRYLPEGASGTFFKSRIVLLNPNAEESTVNVRFQRSNGAEVVAPVTMPPMTQRTIDAEQVLGGATAEFSTVVESFPAVIADRTMTFDAAGAYGSHAETSLPAPAAAWQVSEGTTQAGFNLFVLLQNPNLLAAQVQLTFLRPAPAPPIVKTTTVNPGSRQTLWVNVLDPGLVGTDVSIAAVSTNGVTFLMERSMYLDRPGQVFAAGADSAGVDPALNWFFGEGATGPYFDTFVLLSNATAGAANVTGTYLLPGGGTVVRNYVVPANSRGNVWVDLEDPLLADTAVSSIFTVTNGVPIVAERTMWWPGPDAASWHEAHTSAGATATGTKWGVADGEAGGPGNVRTFFLVANTSPFAGEARVRLVFGDGAVSTRVFALAPTSRLNVEVAAAFPEAAGRRFGAVIESLGSTPAQIVVERSMYSDAGGVVWAAGTNVLATRIP